MTAERQPMYSELTKADGEDVEATIVCQVVTTDKDDQCLTVADALKDRGSVFTIGNDANPFLLLESYSNIKLMKSDKNRKVWTATEHYKTRTISKPDNQCRPDRARISGSFYQDQVPAEGADLDGRIIWNAAELPFPQEEVMIDRANGIIRIDIEQNTISLGQLEEFTNSVNANTFFGAAPGTVKMDAPNWTEMFTRDCVPYYAVSYQFRGNPDGWQLKPRNRGLLNADFELNTDETTGLSLGGPGDLDADGEFLGAGATPLFYDGTNGLEPFNVYPEKNFALLGIPTSLS